MRFRNNILILTAVTLIFCMFNFIAVYADETPDTILNAETAAERLQELGIISGDPDGNLRLDDSLTRAEMAAVVCRLLGMKEIPNKATVFSDVPAEHWASGYIDTAYRNGIISGSGDGTFSPDNKVTYGDVAKMLITLSGFGPQAEQTGGYPRGCLFAASKNGTLDGLNIDIDKDGGKICSRGEMMIMTANAVDVPMMVETDDGAILMDGVYYPLQTIGTKYLGL